MVLIFLPLLKAMVLKQGLLLVTAQLTVTKPLQPGRFGSIPVCTRRIKSCVSSLVCISNPRAQPKSTGLVSIPLKKSELSSFDPLVDAHPENVLLRFDELKARVDMFCQEANLGEGFPYGDMGLPLLSLGSRAQ